ncbi:PAS-domain containing protein [Seohaeicola saemankumensis]|nr:PAS-domain containing protein [Seohaeicola saemankumensis]MCA0870067.1 PAS-domain containing protein [Seohaeicola saemankumensis]
MPDSFLDPSESPERQNAKLLRINRALMRRVELGGGTSGAAYAQFQRAALLEEEVRARTRDLEHALDLLNQSNAQLAAANAETEAARANLANAIETVQEGFALFDPADRLVMCNSRFGKHMRDVHHLLRPGLRFADYVQLISASPYLSLPEGDTPDSWAAARMARHKDDHVVFNARMAGSRWLQVSEHRTSDGGTVVLQTDVTDMVRLERQERERLLDDQAQLIRATLEHLNQGVGIFDSAGRLAGWNHRMGELLQIPVGRFHVGASFASIRDELRRVVSFSDPGTPAAIDAWVAGDRRAPLSFEMMRGADRTLSVFAQQMPDQGFVISFTDISAERSAVRTISDAKATLEQRVMERTMELEDALAEAERANASKSRFVAAASHDLLQPLSAAKLYVASLEQDVASPNLHARLEKAGNALISVENILEALLDISKLDSGRAAVHVSPVPLGALMQQLRDEMWPQAQNKGLQLRLVPTSAVVRSDATYLRRILQNLMSNAIRYTDRGKVLVGVRPRGGSVRLDVWDTGAGIPDHQQDRVFDEFHRLNATASAADGMGLGLAIVERACRLLKHPLQLQSEFGRGTRVSVDLPLDGRAPTQAARPATPEGPLDHRIILLIEDDTDLRHALTLTLEGWGMDVFACASQREALALLDEVDIAPDLMISDYQLEDGQLGTDAIAALRARFGPLPACLITANRTNAMRDACAESGVTLLHKPLDPGDLRQFLATG